MNLMAHDLRYALRNLAKNPGYAAVAILTLALGIGAATSMFSVIYSVLLRPLPFHDPGRLVLVYQTNRTDPRQPLLLDDLLALKAQAQSFSNLAIYYKNTGFSRVTLTTNGEPESVQGAFVTANLFTVLGVQPAIGRAFTLDEEMRGERVAVLSDSLWRKRFGAARDLEGKTVEIDGARFRIAGVLPAAVQFPAREMQFWAPITTNRYWLDHPVIDARHVRDYYARWNAVARLQPGVSLEQAQAETSVIGKRLAQANPALNGGLGLELARLRVELSGKTERALFILSAAVLFLLLIACANVANLILARGASRYREMAIRTQLGAERIRLIRQMLTESLVLAALSGSLGLMMAMAGVRAIVAFGPPDLIRIEQTDLNIWVIAFALAVSFASSILAGIVPALKISRPGSVGAGAALSRSRAVLVALEFALTVILLTGAGLLIRSFFSVQAVDLGFAPEHVLTMRISLPTGVRSTEFYGQVLERVQSIPGVSAAGAINGVFELTDASRMNHAAPSTSGLPRVWATWKNIRGDYLEAMGVRLLRGRAFNPADNANAPLVAIIDESMARRYWPGENAVGKQFRGQDARGRHDDPLTVVGVIRDMRTRGRESPSGPHVFQPVAQAGEATTDLIVRASGDPVRLVAAVRDAARSIHHSAIISGAATLEQQLADQLSARTFRTWLLSFFSLTALILASVGIYGVMHYAVAQRTREIGIRMALGAQVASVIRLVLWEGLTMTGVGVMCGLAGAVWLTQALGSILYGVTSTDPTTYASATALLVGVAAAATLIPALRAARIDPLEALRQE